jgi:hypothetical protein
MSSTNITVYDSDHNRSYARMRCGGSLPQVNAFETMDDALRSPFGGIFYCIEAGYWLIRVDTGSDWIVIHGSIIPTPDSSEYFCYMHADIDSHSILGAMAVRDHWNDFNELLKQHKKPADVRGYQYQQLKITGRWPSDRQARQELGLSMNHWTLLCAKDKEEDADSSSTES